MSTMKKSRVSKSVQDDTDQIAQGSNSKRSEAPDVPRSSAQAGSHTSGVARRNAVAVKRLSVGKSHPVRRDDKRAGAPMSKSDQARDVFERLHRADAPRKDVIKTFTEVIGLTPSGASTYYQKFLTESKSKVGSSRSGTTSQRGRPIDESSKAGMARAIFKRMAKSPRKDVLTAFVDEAGLTPAGASTYYQIERHKRAA